MVIVWSLCNLKMINLSIWQLLTLHTVLMRVVIKLKKTQYIMSKQKKDLLNTKEVYHYLSYENRLHYWN